MARNSYGNWALAAPNKQSRSPEDWESVSAFHDNDAKVAPTANTYYAVTSANQKAVPLSGDELAILAGVKVATTVATITFEIEGTPYEDLTSAQWAVLGYVDVTPDAIDTLKKVIGILPCRGLAYARFSRFKSTGTGNLSAINAILGVTQGYV